MLRRRFLALCGAAALSGCAYRDGPPIDVVQEPQGPYTLAAGDRSVVVRVRVIEVDKKKPEGPVAAFLCHADLVNLGIPVQLQRRVIARPYQGYYQLPEWTTAFACPRTKLE